MKKTKIFLTLVFLIFYLIFVEISFALPIIDIELNVNKNDTVKEVYVNVTDGEPTIYFENTGDYRLNILDANNSVVFTTRLDIQFGSSINSFFGLPDIPTDTNFLYVKVPFSARMQKIELLHKNKTIYTRSLETCDFNYKCEGFENSLNCPSDCVPLQTVVPFCDKDKICEPEFLENSTTCPFDCEIIQPRKFPWKIAVIVSSVLTLVISVILLLKLRSKFLARNKLQHYNEFWGARFIACFTA